MRCAVAAVVALVGLVGCSPAAELAPDARPGAVDGDWAITWTCTSLCWPEPAILRTRTLAISAGTVVWDAPDCADCRLEHVGVARGDCLDVAAGDDNANDQRDAYSACTTGPATLRADVGVRRTGGTDRLARWRASGVRVP